MKISKTKSLYWTLRVFATVISCAFPVWAIAEKFPIWHESYGTVRTVGVGAILALIVLLVVFRKTVFSFIEERLNLKNAPPLAIWIVLLILSYVMAYVSNFVRDLSTVFWMGLVGCAIGTVITFIAERFFGREKADE